MEDDVDHIRLSVVVEVLDSVRRISSILISQRCLRPPAWYDSSVDLGAS